MARWEAWQSGLLRSPAKGVPTGNEGSNPSASATMNLLGWSEGLVHPLGGDIPRSNLIMASYPNGRGSRFKRGSVTVRICVRLRRAVVTKSIVANRWTHGSIPCWVLRIHHRSVVLTTLQTSSTLPRGRPLASRGCLLSSCFATTGSNPVLGAIHDIMDYAI